MEALIISGSLRPESRSRVLARRAEKRLRELGATVSFLDLREHPLPLCDGDAAYDNPQVEPLAARIRQAHVILVAVPIYNFDINAAVKNLVELTGSAWEDKVVGFLCAAGGRASYMSVMNLANDLMLDFRCLIIPRFVYAVGSDFKAVGDQYEIAAGEVIERVDQLCAQAERLGRLIGSAPA